MLSNVQNTEDWLRLNELTYWEVKSRDQDNSLIFSTDENDPIETRFSKFRQAMDLSKAGRYIIYASAKEGAKKGRFREEFSSLNSVEHSAAPSVNGISSIPEGYVSRTELENILAKERLSMKMERLEAELEDLKKENKELNTPVQEFWRKVAPVAPAVIQGILGKFIPAPMPAAVGMLDVENKEDNNNESENEEIELKDEEYTLLMKYLADWKESDPDWLTLLGKISEMAKSKNPFYEQAKAMLLNM